MNAQVKSLIAEAKRLSPEERLELVDELLTSLAGADAEIERLWGDEAERRLAAYQNGDAEVMDAAEVIDALRRRAQ
jgi:putative addiction module component (TIGR02574 family)